MDAVIAARCLHCRGEFTAAQIEGAHCCPTCENRGIPADPSNDVQILVNWQELRILVMWAERWASKNCFDAYSVPTVRAIAAAIEVQHPAMTKKAPLTLLGEFNQIRNLFPGMGRVEQTVVEEAADLTLPGPESVKDGSQ